MNENNNIDKIEWAHTRVRYTKAPLPFQRMRIRRIKCFFFGHIWGKTNPIYFKPTIYCERCLIDQKEK